ncbi:hypothetical protein LY625_10940 [Lysobacter sp. GX 14042]|uniref:2'-5' RNA ligase family protein n=1 Tax=Lysobacter sp. GX 14042 TaxID=2907155 RepID=UPI001F4457BC|nr:hypothetical protein [Lysobacter sp. GX 14042]MCE7033123.1 hypothetical protein [Lysobacter sp. GX 14042]
MTGTIQKPSLAPIEDAGWPGHGNRLLFILRPSAQVRAALADAVAAAGVTAALGNSAFPPGLWHQSVSDRYADRPDIRERLLAAGAGIQARGFTLELDQVRAARNRRGSFNVDARERRGSGELDLLIASVNASVEEQGLPPGGGHTPHVTLSYGFHGELPPRQPMRRVDWAVDSLELVVGGGAPYHYETLGRWPLGPAAARASQASLF